MERKESPFLKDGMSSKILLKMWTIICPNGHLLYESRKWQLDKDKNGGNEYSLENCIVLSAEENGKTWS